MPNIISILIRADENMYASRYCVIES